jgi:hypothetical protein
MYKLQDTYGMAYVHFIIYIYNNNLGVKIGVSQLEKVNLIEISRKHPSDYQSLGIHCRIPCDSSL